MTAPGGGGGMPVAAAIIAALTAAGTALDPAPTAEIHLDRQAWSWKGQEFAIAQGASASLRLGMEIAVAATRTPNVAGSELGPDWVRFSPPTLDDHARDRLVAWFAAAHRRAGPAAR